MINCMWPDDVRALSGPGRRIAHCTMARKKSMPVESGKSLRRRTMSLHEQNWEHVARPHIASKIII